MIRKFLIILVLIFISGCTTKHYSAPVTAKAQRDSGVHVVAPGETIYAIAWRYGWDHRALAELNNLKPPYVVKTGQRLRFNTPDGNLARIDSKVLSRVSDARGAPVLALGPSSNFKETVNFKKDVISHDKATVRRESLVVASKKTIVADNSKPKENTKIAANSVSVTHEPSISNNTATLTNANNAVTNEQPPITNNVAIATERSSNTITSTVSNNSGIKWHWPAIGKLTGKFAGENKGIDIAGALGSDVKASADGSVVYSGSGLRGYGNMIIIKHSDEYLSAYAHNNSILVTEGENVKAGQKIAEMGNSEAKNVRLHFEIRHNGKPIDPSRLLPSKTA